MYMHMTIMLEVYTGGMRCIIKSTSDEKWFISKSWGVFLDRTRTPESQVFPDVSVVPDITRAYFYRSRESLISPGQVIEYVLPSMSVRIAHAASASFSQEISVHRHYEVVDTAPVAVFNGAGRNELDWVFYNKTQASWAVPTRSDLAEAVENTTDIILGYQCEEDSTITLDFRVDDLQRWDVSYLQHRVEVGTSAISAGSWR